MNLKDWDMKSFPQEPGVYKWLDGEDNILYIGKATNLRTRVRSYFDDDLIKTRGRWIVDMTTKATRITFETTPTVLEALVLEAALIKKWQPPYNTREKDNRSFVYVVITDEEFPRIIALRERTAMMKDEETNEYLATYGPFPSQSSVKELLKIIRRTLPYRGDKCAPHLGKPCFDRQIGLCPGVCTDEISKRSYAHRIKEIRMLFEGHREELISEVEKEMHKAAGKMHFEEASEYKRMLFALTHINDVALITDDTRLASQVSAGDRSIAFRIEAYDIAHLFGTHTVGVMTVIEDGRPNKSQYRKFKIKEAPGAVDDLLRTREVLTRRFGHPEWRAPDLIVIDGGLTHLRHMREVLKGLGAAIPVVSVVKDERHKAKAILGNKEFAASYKPSIILANLEAHRFAIEYHKQLRGKLP
jgi:excinuclease ABC subunit C